MMLDIELSLDPASSIPRSLSRTESTDKQTPGHTQAQGENNQNSIGGMSMDTQQTITYT